MAEEDDDNINTDVDYSQSYEPENALRGNTATRGLPEGLGANLDTNQFVAKNLRSQMGSTDNDFPLPLTDYYPTTSGAHTVGQPVGGMNIISQGENLFPFGLADYRLAQARQARMANMQDSLDGVDLASISDLKNNIFQQQQLQDYREFFNTNISKLQGEGFSKSQASQYLMNSPDFKVKLMQWRNVASNYDKTLQAALAVQTDRQAGLHYDQKTRDLASQFNDVVTANKVDVGKLAQIQNGLSKMVDFNKILDPYVNEFGKHLANEITIDNSNPDFSIIKKQAKGITQVAVNNAIDYFKAQNGGEITEDQKTAIKERLTTASTPVIQDYKIQADNLSKQEALEKYKKDLDKQIDVTPNSNVAPQSDMFKTTDKTVDSYNISSPKYDKDATLNLNGKKYRVDQLEITKDGRGMATARPIVQEEGKPMMAGKNVVYENPTTGMTNIGHPALKNNKGEFVDTNGKVVDDAHKVGDPAWQVKYSTKDVFGNKTVDLHESDVRSTLESNGFNFKGLGDIKKTSAQYHSGNNDTRPTEQQVRASGKYTDDEINQFKADGKIR